MFKKFKAKETNYNNRFFGAALDKNGVFRFSRSCTDFITDRSFFRKYNLFFDETTNRIGIAPDPLGTISLRQSNTYVQIACKPFMLEKKLPPQRIHLRWDSELGMLIGKVEVNK